MLSIVIPLFNEELCLPRLLSRVVPVAASLDPRYELILVDDGSTDSTPRLLEAAALANPNLKAILFTRNFGHQAAVSAGFDCCTGECVLVMDADLQEPPELLPRMVSLYLEGYDIVSPQRVCRHGDSRFKRLSAKAFYWLMQNLVDRRVVPEVGDFRLFSLRAVHAIRSFREKHRFLRGLIAWLGLREAILPFERQERIAGQTKYPLFKMLSFSWIAISSFSGLPLRVAMMVGLGFFAVDLFLIAYILYVTLVLHDVVPGWASIILVQALFSGVTLICVGLVGDYVARIYEETKQRPLYVVDRAVNVDDNAIDPRRGLYLTPRGIRAQPARSNSI